MTKLPDHYDDVGPGWAVLLTMLHVELESICPDYQVTQVKEKWGGLRAYLDFSETTDPGAKRVAYTLVHLVEARSLNICEFCGRLGKNEANAHGWWQTLCPEHRARLDTDGPMWKWDRG